MVPLSCAHKFKKAHHDVKLDVIGCISCDQFVVSKILLHRKGSHRRFVGITQQDCQALQSGLLPALGGLGDVGGTCATDSHKFGAVTHSFFVSVLEFLLVKQSRFEENGKEETKKKQVGNRS